MIKKSKIGAIAMVAAIASCGFSPAFADDDSYARPIITVPAAVKKGSQPFDPEASARPIIPAKRAKRVPPASNYYDSEASSRLVPPNAVFDGVVPPVRPKRVHDDNVIRVITAAATKNGVPVRLALSVARVESRFNCRAIGRAGEHGLFQIKPATARGIGFAGSSSSLLDCETNAHYGTLHLKHGLDRCGTEHGAATLHNRGLGASCVRTAYSAVVQQNMFD